MNNQINIADFNMKLLEKTEENTLYIIQQQKEIEILKAENIEIRKALCEIKPQLEMCR